MLVEPGSGASSSTNPPPPHPEPSKTATSFAAMLDRNSTHSVGTSPATTTTSPAAAKPAATTTQPTPLQQAKTAATAGENKLGQDENTLKTLQGQLQDIKASKEPTFQTAGRFAGEEASVRTNRIDKLNSQITAAQGQIAADQQAVAAGKSNVAAAQKAQATADNYKAPPPAVSVKDPVTKAVLPIVDARTTQTHTDRGKVAADSAALNQTRVQLDNLNTAMDNAVSAGMLKRLSQLQQQQQTQQLQLKADQHNLDVGTANLAAANAVVYGQQATADQKALGGATAALKKAGVTLDPKTGGPQKNLTKAQLDAYNDFITKQAKVKADAGMVGQAYAQLQSYASDKKYGNIAQDAQRNVNKAIEPFGFTTNPVTAIDPKVAAKNLGIAKDVSEYYNAGLAAANYQAAFNSVTQVELGSAQPSDLKGLSPQAQQAALTAKANYDQASAYQDKVGTGIDVDSGKQTLATAQAAYDKSPTAENNATLAQAQQQLQTAQAMSDIANANFQATSAKLYANQQSIELARLQQQLGLACAAPNSPLGKQVAQAQANAASANLVANNLDNYTGKLLADYNVSQQKSTVTALQQAVSNAQASEANPASSLLLTGYAFSPQEGPVTANPASPDLAKLSGALTAAQQDLKAAQQQQALAQYQLSNSQFELTLPANLLDPQTETDKKARSQAYDSFFKQHPGTLTDGQVAQQLAALKSPDEKVDVQQGLKELGQDASDEHKALGDRSLLQKGADMIGGWFGADRSQLDTTLTNDQAALQKLQGEKNQMSAQDYNAAYLKIMGNLGPQYDTMYQNERNTDKNWSTAQDVVRDVAIAGVATAVAIATAGTATPLVALAAGTLAGVGTAEGIDTAQNAATVFSGGNVNDNSHISLTAALSGNFFQGNDSWGEVGHAGVDLSIDGVESFGAAASVGVGSMAGDTATSMITSATSRTADSALTRIASGSARMFATQGTMGAGNLAGTSIESQYQVFQGSITEAQALQQMDDGLKGYLKSLAVAGATGGITSAMDIGVTSLSGSEARASSLTSHPLYQLASNAGANTVLTSPGVLTGKAPNAQQWLSIGLNTVSGLAAKTTAGESNGATETSTDPVVIDMASANHNRLSNVVGAVRQANEAYIPPNTPSPSVAVLHESAFEQAYLDAGGRLDPAEVNGFTKLGTDPEIVVRYNKDASAMESVVAHEAVHSLTHPSFVSAAAKAANTVVVNPDGTIKLPTANMIEGVASHEAQKVVPGAQPYPEEARIVAAIEQEMSSNRFNPSDALRKAVYGGDPAAIARFMQLAGEASPGSSSAGVTSTALAASTTPQDPSRRGLDSFLQRIASERNANNPSGYSDIYRLYNRPTTPQSFEGAPEAQLEKARQYLTSLQRLIEERPAGNEHNSLSQNHAPSSSSEVIQDILDQGTALRAGDFFHYLSADAPDSVSHRVYINASIDHAPEIMAFVVKDIVDSPDEKFRGVDSAKIASPASAGRRNENIVIYVDSQRTQQNVLQELAAYHDANPDHFAPEIPALTEPFRPGIAIADEPSPSMVQTLNDKLGQSKPDYSFGESRAIALHLAYTDAVNASGNGTVDPATFAEKAAERFAELGIDPNDPSKNLPETGSDQAMSPQLSSPQSPSVSPASAETQAIPDVAGQPQLIPVTTHPDAKVAAAAMTGDDGSLPSVTVEDTGAGTPASPADSAAPAARPDLQQLQSRADDASGRAAQASQAAAKAQGLADIAQRNADKAANALNRARAAGGPRAKGLRQAEATARAAQDKADDARDAAQAAQRKATQLQTAADQAQQELKIETVASAIWEQKDRAGLPNYTDENRTEAERIVARGGAMPKLADTQGASQAAGADQNVSSPAPGTLVAKIRAEAAKIAKDKPFRTAEQNWLRAQRKIVDARAAELKDQGLTAAKSRSRAADEVALDVLADQLVSSHAASDMAQARRDLHQQIESRANEIQAENQRSGSQNDRSENWYQAQHEIAAGVRPKSRIFGNWRASSKEQFSEFKNGDAKSKLKHYLKPAKYATKKSVVLTGKGIKKTIKYTVVINAGGLAAGVLYYFGVQSKRKSGQVTASNALSQLAQLEANPDKYMKDNYTYTLLGIPDRDLPVGGGTLDNLARNGDIDNGHLLQVPNPDGGSPYYFRRVPQDLYEALKQVYDKQNHTNSSKVFVKETITDASGKPESIQVEIRPPYRMEPLRDASLSIQHEQKSNWFGGGLRITGAIGPIEGDRPNFSLELMFNERYDLPTVSTVRAGLPSETQENLGVGVRQQNTTVWSDIAAGGGTISMNAAHVKDLTDKSGLFGGDQMQAFNVRPYIYIGNRNRVRVDATTSGWDSLYARGRETGFVEPGLGIDFFKETDPDGKYTSFNGYYELQLYAPDLRVQGNLKGLMNPSKVLSGSGLKVIPPLFEIDPALQVSTTKQHVPFAPGVPIPRVVPNVPYLDAGHPWEAASSAAAKTGPLPPALTLPPISANGGNPPVSTPPQGGNPNPKPAAPKQYVVTPLAGLKVRSHPSLGGQKLGNLSEGSFVVATSTPPVNADGERWMEVTGRSSGGEDVKGWIAQAFVAPHPSGAEGATGRIDPILRRRGDPTVEVSRNDTLSEIAGEHRISLATLEAENAAHVLDPDLIYPGDIIYLPTA